MSKEHQTNLLEALASAIDIGRCRVEATPSLIFLCGGRITVKESESSCSARDTFWRSEMIDDLGLRKKLVLAESVFERFPDTKYPDLLTFERDLAELAALTVIFVESSGSIAELGSFSILGHVCERLALVVQEKHAEGSSFIWQGPVRYLINKYKPLGSQPVFVYDWGRETENGPEELSSQDSEDLAGMLHKVLEHGPKTSSFSTSKTLHVMLLMMEFLRISYIATTKDIRSFLVSVDGSFSNTSHVDVRQRLDLLVTLDYVARKRYGSNVYYISKSSNHWIRLAYRDNAMTTDDLRWQSALLEWYEESAANKTRAYRSWLRGRS